MVKNSSPKILEISPRLISSIMKMYFFSSVVFAFAFLWTSDSLSEEKRFCARLSFHESPVSLSSKILPIKPYFVDIIECPADMDMAVQLACVKKMEKK